MVTLRPTRAWAGLEATGLDLLANAAKRKEISCQQGLAPWQGEDRILGPPLRSSPRSFQGRGPPGHAAGLSTSLRSLP